jgi:hypothetical protein
MVNYSAQRRLRMSVAATLMFLSGCGPSDWGNLSGTVLLNGQPVGPGTISLEPIDGDRAGAFAEFGDDGKYQVTSSGRKEGARIGEYQVVIRGGEGSGEEIVGPRPKNKIPARYSNPKTSDLKVTIAPGKQTHDFDLKP